MKKRKGIGVHVFLWIYVIVTLYPILWAFQNSLKVSADVVADPFGLPTSLHIQNYFDVWVKAKVSTYFFNSFYIATTASVVSIVIAAMVAYAVTRMRYQLPAKIVKSFIGLALLLPGSFLLIPLFRLVSDLHIKDTPFAILFPYITFGIPLTMFIISAFLKSIPNDLEEAGVMDGLTAFGLFWRIILPLTLPALVTVFILNFLGNWNEFIMASFFITADKYRTLPVGMVAFRDSLNQNYGGLFAATMFSIIPVIIIYAFLQEKIIEGVTAGSIKG
ncbi:carbohydrate ABC transporter permease [Paenibacillus sp. N1-5-1-14]|uniref:carbohydrate ABC transporter permease n=1 Tax=Paenibacillus radicibacter TaxID=2972488 RepID=UPI002159848B|nr:carbohydrate ABC transporter permease [Paenibacillus radicibacter]MCR8644057.1 carbohydrate ABC transporter permease [Paenibacillus radicibacter]